MNEQDTQTAGLIILAIIDAERNLRSFTAGALADQLFHAQRDVVKLLTVTPEEAMSMEYGQSFAVSLAAAPYGLQGACRTIKEEALESVEQADPDHTGNAGPTHQVELIGAYIQAMAYLDDSAVKGLHQRCQVAMQALHFAISRIMQDGLLDLRAPFLEGNTPGEMIIHARERVHTTQYHSAGFRGLQHFHAMLGAEEAVEWSSKERKALLYLSSMWEAIHGAWGGVRDAVEEVAVKGVPQDVIEAYLEKHHPQGAADCDQPDCNGTGRAR